MFADPAPSSGERGEVPRRPRHAPARSADRRSPAAVATGLVAPMGIAAVLSLPTAFFDLPLPRTGFPIALLIVALVQLAGAALVKDLDEAAWRVWVVALATTTIVLPALALQAASSRVPFVSVASGSARFLIWSTLAAAAVVIGLGVVTAVLGADSPESASLLFLPAAVLVPAVLAAPGGPSSLGTSLNERSALLALGESSTVAAVVAFVGWMLPLRARPPVGAVALGLQFVVLWLLGQGPRFAEGRGAIISIAAVVLLLTTTLTTVVVPIAALVVRRFLQTIRADARPGVGGRGSAVGSDPPTREGAATRPSARPRDH